MTKSLILIICSVLFVACGDSENNVPTQTIIESIDDLSDDDIILQETFSSVNPYTPGCCKKNQFLCKIDIS